MSAVGIWLALFGMWPIGTLGGHDDLSGPMLAADLAVHLLGLGIAAAAVAGWLEARS